MAHYASGAFARDLYGLLSQAETALSVADEHWPALDSVQTRQLIATARDKVSSVRSIVACLCRLHCHFNESDARPAESSQLHEALLSAVEQLQWPAEQLTIDGPPALRVAVRSEALATLLHGLLFCLRLEGHARLAIWAEQTESSVVLAISPIADPQIPLSRVPPLVGVIRDMLPDSIGLDTAQQGGQGRIELRLPVP